MTMRPLILATFALLALAPVALAQETVQPPPGCQSGFYDIFTGSWTCPGSTGGQPTPTPVPTNPSPATGGRSLGSSGNSSNTSGSSLGQTGTNASSGSGQNTTLINPLGAGTSLPVLLKDILQLIVQIGTVIIILMLVYVGFLFVTAQGNESKISEARKALLWTVVGALILLGAQAISLGIQSTVQALSTGP